MKKTQEQWTIDQLLNNGEVSRNAALQNFITRLGAIICNLNSEGWEIRGHFRKYNHGKDFVYTLVSSPFKRVVYTVPALGKEIIKYEKK